MCTGSEMLVTFWVELDILTCKTTYIISCTDIQTANMYYQAFLTSICDIKADTLQ